ncbi:MAG TPA: hypothetical protein VHY83_10835 [Solirubrobacteraceae bacterium]|nr:hypothetical protein [Solirubrobacteraceae bacterium]
MTERPELKLIAPGASPEEAAAIVAALERFVSDTAAVSAAEPAPDPWARAAILEGVAREDPPDLADPWINT